MSTNPKMTTARRTAHLSLAAVALGLNALFAWGAIQATATVPPLRAWQTPAPLALEAADQSVSMQTIRVAGLAAARVARAALVQ
jgi:hypothetical protein